MRGTPVNTTRTDQAQAQAQAQRSSESGIEPHGVPGTAGRPAGPIRRHYDPTAFAEAMWLRDPSRTLDVHAGFRSTFTVQRSGAHTLLAQAPSTFRIWIDGEPVVTGPLRFAPSVPEFHRQQIALEAGEHTIAVHAHGEGLVSRTAAPLPNFVWARIDSDSGTIPLEWLGREFDEFEATGLRTSPLLGWLEWQDRPWAGDWKHEDLASARWSPVARLGAALDMLGPATPSDLALPRWPELELVPMSSGTYRETFAGYRLDDPGAQFLLADDGPDPSDDRDGTWTRYDLGRIRIGAANLTVTSDGRAEVTIGYAERLTPDGRPSPMVALSTGPTRMIQRYAVAAGTTRIEPLQALGGRFLEVRVEARGEAEISDASFVERDMLGAPIGFFESGDRLLDRIWMVGIDTLRASAEDSLVDSVRERGEWVGDVVSSALHILASGWGDYRLVRRALLHAAAGAREDGLVAGCGPGELIYLGTYAAQWMTACLHVAEGEGSTGILEELEEPARANMAALIAAIDDHGGHWLPWSFVDWGYGVPTDQPDLAVLCHVVKAIESWIRWQTLLKRDFDRRPWMVRHAQLSSIVREWLESSVNPYHSYTLAENAGIVTAREALAPVRRQLESGFPFNPHGSRLRDPTQVSPDVVTPYFTNYSVPLLLRAGLRGEVADLWRKGWGWMLDRGATTWWEVFDDRWSQCHYWSGSPTWQMSRHGLGLKPGLDAEGSFVSLDLNDLGLASASGRVPLPGGAWADIEWTRRGASSISYELTTDGALMLRSSARGSEFLEPGRHSFTLDIDGGH